MAKGDECCTPIELGDRGADARIHDRGLRVDVVVPERVAKFVCAEQRPFRARPVVVIVEKNGSALDGTGASNSATHTDRLESISHTPIAADNNLPRSHDTQHCTGRRRLDTDVSKLRERVPREDCECVGEIGDQPVDFCVGEVVGGGFVFSGGPASIRHHRLQNDELRRLDPPRGTVGDVSKRLFESLVRWPRRNGR